MKTEKRCDNCFYGKINTKNIMLPVLCLRSKLCNACHERDVKLAENMRSYINKDNRKWDKDIERDVREIEKKRHDGAC